MKQLPPIPDELRKFTTATEFSVGATEFSVGFDVPQAEIDHINELHLDLHRTAKRMFKQACEIGDWFIKTREKARKEDVRFIKWCAKKFPKIDEGAIYKYMRAAANRDFLTSIRSAELLGHEEALRLIRQNERMAKPRVRAVVVKADAEPAVLLEAKLKNYVIQLWTLRYLQAEIEQLLAAMELKPDQILRVLHYVCKEHHEVEAEVVKTFQPKLKIVPKGA